MGLRLVIVLAGRGRWCASGPRGQAKVGAPQQPLNIRLADGKLQLEGYDLDVLAEAGGADIAARLLLATCCPAHPNAQTFSTCTGSRWYTYSLA